MTAFPSLARPLQVGPLTLPNRLVQTGHATAMADRGLPGAQLAAYYGERARGGVAMIITEAQSVHPTASTMAPTVGLFQPGIVEAYQAISADLQAHDTRFIAQLWHCGNNTDSMVIERAAWSASAVAGPLNHEIPHVVTEAEIAELVAAYAEGAAVARRGGCDGVEIHMGHGYLPHQFLSPVWNKRTDAYGGSPEKRLRFPLEILLAVAEACGPDMAVGVRLSGEDGIPGGMRIDDTARVAKLLEQSGKVAYFNVSFGTYANMEIQTAPMGMPTGHLAPLAAAVRAQVSTPVLAVGRMLTPDVGERLVADGAADLIGMARELICDPEYAGKALRGRADEIRPCIGCNHCQSRLWAAKHVTCIHNPAAGRERELGAATRVAASSPRSVVVVGGGPAGMEAAIVAADNGHRVRLLERGDALGGQLRYAAAAPSRGEVAKVVAHREALLARLGVDVQLECEIAEEDVAGIDADVVVLATGSTPHAGGFNGGRPDLEAIPGLEHTTALTSWDVFDGRLPEGEGTVLVVDFEGHVQALAVTDFLLELGRRVEFVTAHPQIGQHVGGTAWVKLMQEVSRRGAHLVTSTALVEVLADGSAELADVYGGPAWTLTGVDAVVVVGDARANDALAAPLRARGDLRVIEVGDCVAPRHLDMAILEGHRAGRSV